MLKLVRAALGGLAVGALLGMAVGVAIALLHLNVRGLVLLGFALTPSISGLLLGSAMGLLIGLAVGCMWRASGKKR
jgi:hypothetical protein